MRTDISISADVLADVHNLPHTGITTRDQTARVTVATPRDLEFWLQVLGGPVTTIGLTGGYEVWLLDTTATQGDGTPYRLLVSALVADPDEHCHLVEDHTKSRPGQLAPAAALAVRLQAEESSLRSTEVLDDYTLRVLVHPRTLADWHGWMTRFGVTSASDDGHVITAHGHEGPVQITLRAARHVAARALTA
ncbi:hypothetical protein [Streptomyces chilikensis]|uniref:Uncharacterized protein n=1 Tax=Streptomyces chilikensis TaxID=1194079 RepID=A0ABV3EJ80_9ACTN